MVRKRVVGREGRRKRGSHDNLRVSRRLHRNIRREKSTDQEEDDDHDHEEDHGPRKEYSEILLVGRKESFMDYSSSLRLLVLQQRPLPPFSFLEASISFSLSELTKLAKFVSDLYVFRRKREGLSLHSHRIGQQIHLKLLSKNRQ
jgi:hypothetical protein